MHKVYRNSFCNIVAADSWDGLGGLFRERQAYAVLPASFVSSVESDVFGREAWRVVPEDLWEAQLLGSPVYTRAWVFQGK
jgi:hypothetical protein